MPDRIETGRMIACTLVNGVEKSSKSKRHAYSEDCDKSSGTHFRFLSVGLSRLFAVVEQLRVFGLEQTLSFANLVHLSLSSGDRGKGVLTQFG